MPIQCGSFQQLTTTVPPSFCVAIERKHKVVIPTTLPVTLYYWKEEYLSLGVTQNDYRRRQQENYA